MAAAVQALLLYVLIVGLGVRLPAPAPPATQLLEFSLQPPPPKVEIKPPPPAPSKKPQGAASPPNLVSRATEVVAPPPVVPPVPLVVTAPQPGTGSDASSGNAPVAGPGTGAGGTGNGTGSGGAGNGSGAGEGTPLRWRSGSLNDRDYPKAALRVNAQGTVHLRFTVGVNGRVTDCAVTRSSGNRDLDETTCRLIQQRFRYEPSRDALGRPYADVVTGEHVWELWDRPGGEGSTDD